MDGASAVLAFAQLGLSLATTLNTYIADVRHGRDDIANLANEIEATVSHAQELDRIIQENKTTARWSAHGLFLAKKCLQDCQDVIQRLSRLLRRSGGGGTMPAAAAAAGGRSVLPGTTTTTFTTSASDTTSDSRTLVSRTEIDVSLFGRLSWPLFKPQLQFLKQELQKIKIEMLLALSTYQASSTSKEEDRKAIVERIIALWRSRTVARRELVLCGRRLERANRPGYADMPGQNDRFTTHMREERGEEPAHEKPRTRGISPESFDRAYARRRDRRSTRDASDDLEKERPYMTGDEAFEEGRFEHSRDVSTAQYGPPYAPKPEDSGRKNPVKQAIDYALKFALAPEDDPRESKQRILSLWSRYKGDPVALRQLLRMVNTIPSSQPNPKIPLSLQDPATADGLAFTWSLLITRTPVSYTVHPVDYPLPQLTKRLAREEQKSAPSGTLNLEAYAALTTLPPGYRNMITDWLIPDPSSRHHWMLLVLDPVYPPPPKDRRTTWRDRLRLSRPNPPQDYPREPASVLAVFKRCTQADARGSSRAEFSPSTKKLLGSVTPAVAGALIAALRERARDRRRPGRESRSPSRSPSRPRSTSRSRVYERESYPTAGGEPSARPRYRYRPRERSYEREARPMRAEDPRAGPVPEPRVYAEEVSDSEGEVSGGEGGTSAELADRIMTRYTGRVVVR
ncbi:hypothetical protein ASPACDRAFT_58347 [Aspergillus aculeatus ATCC 16872]|uniref:Fungal N-terminal domain-containing protein n=1 Tax=Aspergillus aculeatus (strain ATCC 16872 / CBS 172.66 / WB 5094) TaxID=690307 RepID=A0A1L9X1E6_ASPA1|nr:uncharacterized protein ASPACDRAFT_58347 [Aspergillus aculeatus ATCC 16872]OJK01948.1 hypothetical protein ASPACDRAFT_58347 [Aspergillus aculeatus ATCC 16872]